ncbi:MAG TPA: sialate O-acetylesterase [Candidatus Paceibacterota bacterium]|nr:sialate O-acetylesterase [Candidatus Paceibacterota bacterium]HSA00160.1 sialate O-acetylesterase [Candidatus Paceibacterota bacterium]
MNRSTSSLLLPGCLVALALSASAWANVRLPALFTDHMVLQQEKAIPVWGWADEGETVTVRFRQQTVSTVARGGKWMVRLQPEKPGGPDSLTVSANNQVSMDDVLVGEVWICSGQSNMEWPLSRSYQPEADIQSATNAKIRLFTVPKLKAKTPVKDVKASWKVCQPDEAKNFSAVGYYFGRALQRDCAVPIGLIHTSWGGSPAEVWMSEDVLTQNPEYRRDILDTYPAAWRKYQEQVAAYEKEKAELEAQGKKIQRGRPWGLWRPTELYNGMIAPLIPYAIRGAIWYQGESNAGRAHQYRTLFPDMIRNWRRDWGQDDFTFLAVQLAPYMKIQEQPAESAWAELREAQWLATQVLPNVGMAVITDVGDPQDIHPTKKVPVGERLALAARGIAYGEKITYSGPIYRRMVARGNQAILSFRHVGKGLHAPDGELKGFAVCGPDRHFYWAQAKIEGRRVVVSCPEVKRPVAVRYGWADCPVVNLWNKDGLPASPFRTDDFPMITAPKN